MKLRIISDGTATGTYLLADGKRLENVTGLDVHIAANDTATAVVTFSGVEMDLTLDDKKGAEIHVGESEPELPAPGPGDPTWTTHSWSSGEDKPCRDCGKPTAFRLGSVVLCAAHRYKALVEASHPHDGGDVLMPLDKPSTEYQLLVPKDASEMPAVHKSGGSVALPLLGYTKMDRVDPRGIDLEVHFEDGSWNIKGTVFIDLLAKFPTWLPIRVESHTLMSVEDSVKGRIVGDSRDRGMARDECTSCHKMKPIWYTAPDGKFCKPCFDREGKKDACVRCGATEPKWVNEYGEPMCRPCHAETRMRKAGLKKPLRTRSHRPGKCSTCSKATCWMTEGKYVCPACNHARTDPTRTEEKELEPDGASR